MTINFICTLFLLSCLLFFTSSVNSRPLPAGSSDKVSLGIYYESLDPKSANVVGGYLAEIHEFMSIVDLHLSPWGNARILSNNSIECKRGEKECFLNTIEACAINVWPDVEKHFNFIYCVEFTQFELLPWDICFETMNVDRRPIDECYRSGLGTKLELKYAEETAALKPPLEYTPWVVVDGKPIYEDFINIRSYICKAYKGRTPPESCKSLSSITTPSGKAEKVELSYGENVSRGA